MTANSYTPGQPAPMVHARQCAVLWFSDLMRRHLYHDLGYSSINQYSMTELGFSKSRTGDFVRLARQLDSLPKIKKAMSTGTLDYTKAREILPVATPENQDIWLKAAKGSRRELVQEVKRVKRAAKIDPGQGELMPDAAPLVAARELPVRFQMDLTPAQEARRAALVESKEKTPRGALPFRPPVQIHVHENEGKLTVQTHAGKRDLGPAESERMRCDAAVCKSGGRNAATIPPRIRREVLARDRHQCQAPGCGRTRFLEVHHKVPRSGGGGNKPENLMTLCGSCHRMWHERATPSFLAKSR